MSDHPRPPLDDRASAPERRLWAAHLRSCRECRDRWIAEDPSRLFALLGDEEMDGAVLNAVSASVMDEVRREAGPRRRRAVSPWLPAAAALAAAAVVAAFLVPLAFVTGPQVADLSPAGPAEPGPRHAGVESVSSPGSARVVDLTVGDTQVVMIFDEEFEL